MGPSLSRKYNAAELPLFSCHVPIFFLPSPPVIYPRVQHILPRQEGMGRHRLLSFFFLMQAIHSPMSGINKRLCSLVF